MQLMQIKEERAMATIFFDIDGTIWDRENVIPDSTVEAIRLLQQNGHLAFLCSGRTPVMVFGENLLSLGFDGMLGGCGTYIGFRGQELFSKELEPDLLKYTREVFTEYNIPILVEGINELYMDEGIANEGYGGYIKSVLGDKVFPIGGNEDKVHGCKITALIHERDYKSAVRELEQDYEVLVHKAYVMELIPKGHSKATAIMKTCEMLGIDHKDTYAFGDSINDRDMLFYVAHGIAMGNGTEDAKTAADYITSDLHEDGIYNGLKHFGLI